MPLNFPSSPTNGQIYENYYYDSANSVWQTLGSKLETTANISNTPTGTYTSGGVSYKYVSFTSSGTLTVTRAGLCDVLLVGGGGSGGTVFGGGGGAGGVLYIENAFLPAGSLDVVVGVGGAQRTRPATNHGTHGNNGSPSRLASYYALGGGAGAGISNSTANTNLYYPTGGINGGSGGGDNGWNYANPGTSQGGGLGVTGLGNNGGPGIYLDGGGGGGAGAVGGTPTHPTGGAGGNGIANSITGSSVTYGGGGGGGGYDFGGTAGTGGGGAGSSRTGNGSAGTANTGGGGGGGDGFGGAGGSGIVIVRWVA